MSFAPKIKREPEETAKDIYNTLSPSTKEVAALIVGANIGAGALYNVGEWIAGEEILFDDMTDLFHNVIGLIDSFGLSKKERTKLGRYLKKIGNKWLSKLAFPTVRRGTFGKLLANDLVSVQPMSQPSGPIFFMKHVYGKTEDEDGTQSK